MAVVDWEVLKEEILDILLKNGLPVVGRVSGPLQMFATRIAQQTTECVARLSHNPDDESVRRDLLHLKSQAISIANMMRMDFEEGAMTLFQDILDLIVRSLLAGLIAALGGVDPSE